MISGRCRRGKDGDFVGVAHKSGKQDEIINLTESRIFFNRKTGADEGMKGNPESFILSCFYRLPCFPVQRWDFDRINGIHRFDGTGAGKQSVAAGFCPCEISGGSVASHGWSWFASTRSRGGDKGTVAGD